MQLVASGGVDAEAAPANRPLIFDRLVTEADSHGRSADELRLMRNTIFARAGRTFDDPALRDYFSRQPWYRPAGGPPRKLSALDQKNLAGIKLWEARAKALDGLRKLVPGFDESAANPTRYECGTDAHHALRDKREARRLVLEASRMSWADVPNFADALDSIRHEAESRSGHVRPRHRRGWLPGGRRHDEARIRGRAGRTPRPASVSWVGDVES